MTTTAQRLNELLAPLLRMSPEKPFLDAVAERLKLEGEDSSLRALQIVYLTTKNLHDDIEQSEDKVFLSEAKRLFSPFTSLLNYSSYHLDIKNAKNNFLKAEHLTSLTHLHLMMKGVNERLDLPHDASKEIAIEFAQLKDKVVHTEGLPSDFQKVLIVRLNQISSAFDNFFAFGEDGLERELEALIGSIFLHAPEVSTDEEFSLLKTIWEKAGQGIGLLKSVNDQAGTLISLYEKGQKLLVIFGK